MSGVVRFDERGLVPVVAQDIISGDVLMLAFMDVQALQRTRETGRAHYWSRSRGELWRKGESSGHEQIVEEIRVNCEENSLLLLVRQVGAVCHTGYPTCYFRRLAPDDSLTIVREQVFDPAEVYAAVPVEPTAEELAVDALAEATRRQYGAYAYLRDNDLSAVSRTSQRLRQGDPALEARIADELRELAGVLCGDHRHSGLADDLPLEASQVIYWVLLAAIRDGVPWVALRPDIALRTADEEVPAETVSTLLRRDAELWERTPAGSSSGTARLHATLALVGQACRTGGIDPLQVVNMDLADLRSRGYLAPFFAHRARLGDADCHDPSSG